VITVSNIVSWSDADDIETRRDIRELWVPVGDCARSAEFYRRVFGFSPRATARGEPAAELVVTNGAASVYLRRTRCAALPAWLRASRWAFVVKDVEAAREQVWELGVRIARDSGEPDHIYRRPGAHSLYLHDVDRNEIELVELRGEHVAVSAHVGAALAATSWLLDRR
jgi:catechol 2,3-dioxygenase-like lactoylglutathione lyase family enzyme